MNTQPQQPDDLPGIGPEIDPALDARIEDSIRRTFGADLNRPIDLSALPAEAPPPPTFRFPRAVMGISAMAAVLLLSMTVFIATRGTGSPPAPTIVPGQPVNAARFYTAAMTDFEPEIVCDTPEKFADYTDEAFDLALAADFDAGVELIGWIGLGAYDKASGKSRRRGLLARSQSGERVIAFFAPADVEVNLDGLGDVNTHRWTIGDLTVTEVSNLPAPILQSVITTP
ncbi:MAG: hypothetical protein AAGI17_08190 [Planctomycetota bacterium]